MSVYILSYRGCAGPCGGGQGVTYKLYLSNKQYKLIDNVIFCFKNVSFTQKQGFEYRALAKNHFTSSKRRIIDTINRHSLGNVLIESKRIKDAEKWILALNRKYHFKREDIFILQDFEACYAFIKKFDYPNHIFVYHQQGSLYYEWKSFSGKDSKLCQSFYSTKYANLISRIRNLGFPSYGAKEALLKTETELNSIIEKKECYILYNGFDKPLLLRDPSSSIAGVLERLKKSTGLKFVTVSALNEAKGVDRIPKYLVAIKRQYPDFVWVLVGNGVYSDKLKQSISETGLEENILWVKGPIPHDDVLNLISHTDFYIMLHRFSIFDFSTIEAMAYGNIPVLSNIGGNIEVVKENNGLLVDDVTNGEELNQFINNINIEEYKAKNSKIQNSEFSNFEFLKGYSNVVHILDQSR